MKDRENILKRDDNGKYLGVYSWVEVKGHQIGKQQQEEYQFVKGNWEIYKDMREEFICIVYGTDHACG